MDNEPTRKTILLSVAVIAITLTGWIVVGCGLDPQHRINLLEPLTYLGIAMPFWLPVAFIAYAIGCKRLTGTMVVLFAIGEFASVGVMVGILSHALID